MKKILIILLVSFMVFAWQGCKEEGRIDHLDENAPPPPPVTSVTVKNAPGGAVLRYSIPKNDNLLYVKAVYEAQPGVQREAKASYYVDTLVLEGYGTTGTYPVQVYAVGRNEKTSEPYPVEISPLAPPIETVLSTIKMQESFGGVKFEFANDSEASLAFVLMADTLGSGVWTPLKTFYTKSPKGAFGYRGLQNKEAKFGMYVRDRWNNKSEIVQATLTPIYEEKIDKGTFKTWNLPSDTYLPVENSAAYTIDHLWDKFWGHASNGVFATPHTSSLPMTFTVDFGRSIILSRMVCYQRGEYTYTGSCVRLFEMYGSNVVNPGDDLNGGDWFLLGEFESFMPSGSVGNPTAEDIRYASLDGESFEPVPTDKVPDPWLPVRYVRFKILETWGGNTSRGQVIVAEIEPWGKYVE